MNEIRKYEFEGAAIHFEERLGDWWADTKDVAAALGYADPRKVLNLYKRNEAAFLPGETCVLTLRTQSKNGVEQGRAVRYFSIDGLENLALFGKTAICLRFRRWLLDVSKQLRNGARLVTADQVSQLMQQVHGLLDENRALRAEMFSMARELRYATRTLSITVRSSAQILSERGRQKREREKENRELGLGQRQLPGFNLPALN